jgi:hypothetical protein
MRDAFLGFSISIGFIASILWLVAAFVKVPTNPSGGYGSAVEGLDEMRAGFGRQARYNSFAAFMTAVAMLSQVLVMWIT